ncbi:hypothetical protein [Bradyrhizobium zhanjiangense]|nr:hypothetical protein [Bradyrhizobium zhanjiangense]
MQFTNETRINVTEDERVGEIAQIGAGRVKQLKIFAACGRRSNA